MTTTDTDAEIVATCEAAATYLGEHGRTIQTYAGPDHSACLAGALAIVHLGGHEKLTTMPLSIGLGCAAVPAVAKVIAERHPERLTPFLVTSPCRGTIFAFNDDLQTTDEDVIEVLRETIKRHTPDAYRPDPQEQP